MRETYYTNEYYHETHFYKTCATRVRKRHRLRRSMYSSPCLGRRYTYTPSSDTSDSEPGDLYWVQYPRRRARTFATPELINVDMDRGRPRSFWRSLFGSEYFDVFQRMKREKRTRHEHIERPRSRLPGGRYTYTRLGEPDYSDGHRWEGPRIDSPRCPPSPPRPRRSRWRVVQSRSPEPHARHRWYDLPRRDTGRSQEPVSTQPRPRPARPSSPIDEREPTRRGRYTSPIPASVQQPGQDSRPRVEIIQHKPRPVSPQGSRSDAVPRPYDADFIKHNSVRERINRKRIHSPKLTSPPRSRKVRFREGHEEIDDPVYFGSDSDSSSGSDSESDSSSGPSWAGSYIRSRPRPPVVFRHPRRENPAIIMERRPGGMRAGVERRGMGSTGDVLRRSYQGRERESAGSEGVMYEYREPREQGRVREFRRWI